MVGIKRITLCIVFGLFISGCAATPKTVTPLPPRSVPEETISVAQEDTFPEASVPVVEEKVVKVQSDVKDVDPGAKEAVLEPRATITYSQITNLIGEILDIQPVEMASGRPKFLGTSENELATLEIIGEETDISQASLKLIYPDDIERINADLNNAIMLRFLRNAVPENEEWRSKVKDIIAKFDSMERSRTEKDKIELADKNIEILYNRKTDSISITTKFK